MDLQQALYARLSVRGFTDKPVERAVLLRELLTNPQFDIYCVRPRV